MVNFARGSTRSTYHCVRCLVFYPLSACLTIFGNILLFPFEPGITNDFALLESAASLIRELPMNPKHAHKDRLMELVRKLSERAKLVTRDTRENPGHYARVPVG